MLKNKHLILLLALSGLYAASVQAQHYIRLDEEKITIAQFPFRITQTVYSGSPDEGGCVGFVQKGMNNRKTPAFIEKGIEKAVQDLFDRSLPGTGSERPITVRINKLRVYEVTETNKEYGYVELNLTVLEPDGQGDYWERFEAGDFRNESTNMGRWDVTKAHSFNIAEAITNCLKEFADRDRKGLTWKKQVAKSQLAVYHRPVATPAQNESWKKGIYYTFADFRDNLPVDAPPHRLTGIKTKERGRGRMVTAIPEWENDLFPDQFWGFCDGVDAYVNVKGKNYLVTREDSLLLVRAPAPKDGDAAIYGAMFGLVGALVAGAVENAKANEGFVYKIDLQTGSLKPMVEGGAEAPLESRSVFFASENNPDNTPAVLYIDGERQCELLPGTYFRLKLPPAKTEVNCCVEAMGQKDCFTYEPVIGRTKYWFVHLSKKGRLQVHTPEDTLKDRIKDSIKDGSAKAVCPK